MTLLILDLDGVLITTPPWKVDTRHADGYSDFDSTCVEQLNQLLALTSIEIWLSSSRRTAKTLAEFNLIFEQRGIVQPIVGFLPIDTNYKTRKEEIQHFLSTQQVTNFIIIDDDKSLNGLEPSLKKRLVLTMPLMGFNEDKLAESKEKLALW